MRCKLTFLVVTALFLAVFVPVVQAQRGVGDPAGVARQPVKPKLVTLVGTVAEVQTGPCENTTGRSSQGTHFLMDDGQGNTWNIHLGPAEMVKSVADDLQKDMKITIKAFRTEKMKDGHYVAKSLSYDNRTVTLRDDTLRPTWAGGRNAWRGRDGGSRCGGNGRGRGNRAWRGGFGPR